MGFAGVHVRDQHETCSTQVNLFATARTVASFEWDNLCWCWEQYRIFWWWL